MFVIAAVLLLIVALCAGEQTRLTPHLDAAEACCVFVQCSMVPVALLAFVVWLAGPALRLERVPSARSIARDPLSPPPELTALRAA